MDRVAELHRYLKSCGARRYEPGQFDCALFAAGWVDLIRDTNLVETWQGTYCSLQQGHRTIRKAGHSSLRKFVDDTVGPGKGWAFAQPGDVALMPRKLGALGLVGTGGHVHVLQDIEGLDVVSLEQAWSVHRP